MKFFETDGSEFKRKGDIPPIGFISKEEYDLNTDPKKLKPGWYFQDETEKSNGPYKSLNEAVQAQNDYCRDALGEIKINLQEEKKKLKGEQPEVKKEKKKSLKIIAIEDPVESDFMLGQEVEDKISGFRGIITVKVYNQYRVPQYAVLAKTRALSSGVGDVLIDGVSLRIINKTPIIKCVEPKVKIKLGEKVKSSVTNFTGIVISREVHINGCVRLKIRSEYKAGDETSMTVFTFDEPELEVIKPKTNSTVKPKKSTPNTGCANTKFDGGFV